MITVNPLVSIIVPVYNAGVYLDDSLKSLSEQTYSNLQVILIDDGSKDKSGMICDKYAELDSRFLAFHKENGGVSSARNVGLKKAQGDFIMFLDADDWLEKNTIELLIQAINDNECDFVMFEYYVDYRNGKSIQHLHTDLNGKISAQECVRYSILPINRFAVTKIYSRTLLENVRFDENVHLGEDTLFVCNAMVRSNKGGYFLAKSMYHYIQSENSATRNMAFNDKLLSGKQSYENIIDLCKNHFPDLIKIATSQYCEIMMYIIMEMFKEKKRYKDSITQYANCIRGKLTVVIFDNNCPLSTKIKVLLCSISPNLMLAFRKH